MVLTYVGIDWHAKNSNSLPPSLLLGESMHDGPRGTFRTNGPISMKFGTNDPEKLCYQIPIQLMAE